MPFQDLPDRVTVVRQKIGMAVCRGGHNQDVRIIAVTKTHGPEAVTAAINAGLLDSWLCVESRLCRDLLFGLLFLIAEAAKYALSFFRSCLHCQAWR